MTDLTRDYGEFLFIPAVPNRVIFKGSEDPFMTWMVKSASRNSMSTADGTPNLNGQNGFVPNITRGGPEGIGGLLMKSRMQMWCVKPAR